MDGKRDAAEALSRTDGASPVQAPVRERREQSELRLFTYKVLIVVGVVALAILTWKVAEALLLVFTGVLFAILLTRLTDGLQRWTGLSQGWGLAAVLLVFALAFGGGAWFLGSTAVAQFNQFSEQLGQSLDRLPPQIQEFVAQQSEQGSWISRVRTVASSVLFFLGDMIVVLFAAIYLAASPRLYRRGLVLLVPPSGHRRALEVLDVTGEALWKWLLGQFAAMATVGVLTTAGLWALGVPQAVALGIIAAVLEFIPLIGPFLSAVPAVIIAFGASPETALWVAGLYLLIQQIEGNLVMPMAQKRVVDLPPVITIAAIACGGLLFGILGMFLATPLAVVAMVLVNMLYIEDKLGEGRHFPN